jgi:hypothetical protein
MCSVHFQNHLSVHACLPNVRFFGLEFNYKRQKNYCLHRYNRGLLFFCYAGVPCSSFLFQHTQLFIFFPTHARTQPCPQPEVGQQKKTPHILLGRNSCFLVLLVTFLVQLGRVHNLSISHHSLFYCSLLPIVSSSSFYKRKRLFSCLLDALGKNSLPISSRAHALLDRESHLRILSSCESHRQVPSSDLSSRTDIISRNISQSVRSCEIIFGFELKTAKDTRLTMAITLNFQ